MNFISSVFTEHSHEMQSTATDQLTAVPLTANRNDDQSVLNKISIKTSVFVLDLTTTSLTFSYFVEETMFLLYLTEIFLI